MGVFYVLLLVPIAIQHLTLTGNDIYCEKKNKRVVTYELYTNKFVNDSKEVELYMHIKNGDTYFEQKLYTKAANSYTKALAIKQLDYVIFNRGLARYNSSQYKMAMNDFDKYIVLGKNQEDVERARELRQHAQKLQTQKVNTALGVVAALFGIAAQAVAVATTPQYNTSNYIPTYTNNYTTTTCGQTNQNLDYLLDPTYAMDQVQQQYWNEYLQYTNGGQTMSYEEFMNIRTSVYMEMQNSNTTNNHTTTTNDYDDLTPEPTPTKKTCGRCGGKGTIIEYAANLGINTNPWCEKCGKNVTSGHYHQTCPQCKGNGKY
jgi:tetratricopeptide (TPR) repeat protein